jgi:dephospho-CoA kinase
MAFYMDTKSLQWIVGLTGGMGAGKSTLVEIIKGAGVPVYDVDAAVHALYENSQISDYIGSQIGLEAPVTRQMVAQHITSYPSLLPIVEEIMMENLECDLQARRMFGEMDPFLVIDAPLLFEMGWAQHCDFIIAIQCPREIREERVMKRPGMSHDKMKLLMDKQISEADRLLKSHFIIHNDGEIQTAEAKMLSIIEHLKGFYE